MGIYLGPFRLTKRGVRIRVGPRAARLHIGAGGAGFSTGAGPFTFYQPLRGKKRRRPAAPRHTATRRNTYMTSRQGPDTNPNLPPYEYVPYQSPPRPPRKPWSRRRKITVFSVLGVLVLFVLIGTLGGSPKTPVSHHNSPVIPAAVSSSSATSPAVEATVTTPAPQPSTPAPQQTTQPAVQQTTQAAPAHTTTPAPPPAGCSPKTPSGGCYEPGDFCSSAEHGETGVAGDGAQIECENTDPGSTWHWVAI